MPSVFPWIQIVRYLRFLGTIERTSRLTELFSVYVVGPVFLPITPLCNPGSGERQRQVFSPVQRQLWLLRRFFRVPRFSLDAE